jgi:DNA-binding NarL/FixJ family response regulator
VALVATQPHLALVDAVGDARSAADAAAATRPDIAILDVTMPNGGGVWAAREIGRRSPETRVIAFSGHTDGESARAMTDAGACDYIVKGSPIEVIVETIERAARSGSA